MEEIAENPLLYTKIEDFRNASTKKEKTKKYILFASCISIGLIVGVLIGYLSFGNKKVNESNDTLLKSKPFNNSINILKVMSEGIGVEIDVNFDIDVDLNTLIDQIESGLSTTAVKDSTFSDGSRFVSCLEGGFVIAAYNHPTRPHSATADGGFLAPMIRSEKPPGKWAIAKVSAGLGSRKTYYDSW